MFLGKLKYAIRAPIVCIKKNWHEYKFLSKAIDRAQKACDQARANITTVSFDDDGLSCIVKHSTFVRFSKRQKKPFYCDYETHCLMWREGCTVKTCQYFNRHITYNKAKSRLDMLMTRKNNFWSRKLSGKIRTYFKENLVEEW